MLSVLLKEPAVQDELPKLLLQSDSDGATPFFLAMELGLITEACMLRKHAASADLELPMVRTKNLHGCPPLHALVEAFAALDSQDIDTFKDESTSIEDLLIGAAGEAMMADTDTMGYTALQAFVMPNYASGASSFHPSLPALLHELRSSPAVVTTCLPPACEAQDYLQIDTFVSQLVKCAAFHTAAANLTSDLSSAVSQSEYHSAGAFSWNPVCVCSALCSATVRLNHRILRLWPLKVSFQRYFKLPRA